jgi:hypothetical protein
VDDKRGLWGVSHRVPSIIDAVDHRRLADVHEILDGRVLSENVPQHGHAAELSRTYAPLGMHAEASLFHLIGRDTMGVESGDVDIGLDGEWGKRGRSSSASVTVVITKRATSRSTHIVCQDGK